MSDVVTVSTEGSAEATVGSDVSQEAVDALRQEVLEGKPSDYQPAAPKESATPDESATGDFVPSEDEQREVADRAARAAEAFRQRRANREQLRHENERLIAQNQQQENFLQRLLAGVRQAAAPAPEASKAEERSPLDEPLDDPAAAFQTLRQQNRALEEQIAEFRAERQREVEAWQQQQQMAAQQQQAWQDTISVMQQDVRDWEAQYGEFLSDPQTGETGIYDEWQAAARQEAMSRGLPEQLAQREVDRRIAQFWEEAQVIGCHPCQLIEQDAARLGVRADAEPAPQQALPATSRAAQTVQAAQSAAQSGVAGNIGNGASSPGPGQPRTLRELVESGTNPLDLANSLIGDGVGVGADAFEFLDRLEAEDRQAALSRSW